MKDFVLPNYTPELFEANAGLIAEIYKEHGVVLFPSFFNTHSGFERYRNEVARIFDEILRRHTATQPPDDLGEKLAMLSRLKAIDGKIITDLGTQPNKFNSFNIIKYSKWIDALLMHIYGKSAILATPQAGDTLHFFPPGEVFHRYNLPPHQDYPYLMQSPLQITFYLGLSKFKKGVGGLRIWGKSHKLGILNSKKNTFGSYEILDSESVLKDYEAFDYEWQTGDFGIFDSLLAHSSIPNTTTDCGRVVQIFRFSDLNNATSASYDYRSTCYERRGVLFTDIHTGQYFPDTA